MSGPSNTLSLAALRQVPPTLLFGRPVDTILFAVAMLGLSAVAVVWFDVALAQWARGLHPSMRAFWNAVTQLGDGTGYFVGLAVYIAVCGALLRWKPDYADRHHMKARLLDGAFALTAMIGTGLFLRLLKFVFARPRPSQMFRSDVTGFEWFRWSTGGDWTSYPSGHTQTIWTAALAAYLAFRLPAWPLVAVALMVSASRVLISAHYLGDVIAGAWCGLFGVSMIYYFWQRALPAWPVGATQGWGRWNTAARN